MNIPHKNKQFVALLVILFMSLEVGCGDEKGQVGSRPSLDTKGTPSSDVTRNATPDRREDDGEIEAERERAAAEAELREEQRKVQLLAGRSPFMRSFAWGDSEEVIGLASPEMVFQRVDRGGGLVTLTAKSKIADHESGIELSLYQDKLYGLILDRSIRHGHFSQFEFPREIDNISYIADLLTEKYGDPKIERFHVQNMQWAQTWTWTKLDSTIEATGSFYSDPTQSKFSAWYVSYEWNSPIGITARRISTEQSEKQFKSRQEKIKSDL